MQAVMLRLFVLCPLMLAMPGPSVAQQPPAAAPVSPADYVIGPDDVLSIMVWREKDLSGDVRVRPDGKITLPLMNDVVASGLTPQQLRLRLTEQAGKLVEDAQVTVTVKEINSRRVFITGMVEKPGAYPLSSRMTVLQLIALAGGLKDFARSERIVIIRAEAGREHRFVFDYKEVLEGKHVQQNLEMMSGDTVVVP